MSVSDPAGFGSSWYTESMVAAPLRPPLTNDIDVDACVIGAGLAGLTTARELARRGWSVAVLEARRVAWSASGRNTGFVLPGFAADIGTLVRRVGIDHAKSLWWLSEAGLDYVRTTIRSTGMLGVDPVPGWLKVSKLDNADEDRETVRLLREEIGADIELWPAERVRELLHSRYYFHALHVPHAFHIHPLNYALGLAAAAEAAGARIFEQTPALEIDPEGVRKRVVTPHARIRAEHVVLAGNVHLGPLMPWISGTLLPVSTYVVTTAPLGPMLGDAISYAGAISDTDRADSHYRIVGGDRLMWGGGMTTWEANPRRYINRLRADIARIYPKLRDSPISHAWTGMLGMAVHRMPQLGEFAPRMWIASGFAGHGLNTTAMAGCVLAQCITEGHDTWRLFAPFEFVWAGGLIGRAVAQANYYWSRAREVTEAQQARRRDAQRRRALAQEVLRAKVAAIPSMFAPEPEVAMPAGDGYAHVASMADDRRQPFIAADQDVPHAQAIEEVRAEQPAIAVHEWVRPADDGEDRLPTTVSADRMPSAALLPSEVEFAPASRTAAEDHGRDLAEAADARPAYDWQIPEARPVEAKTETETETSATTLPMQILPLPPADDDRGPDVQATETKVETALFTLPLDILPLPTGDEQIR